MAATFTMPRMLSISASMVASLNGMEKKSPTAMHPHHLFDDAQRTAPAPSSAPDVLVELDLLNSELGRIALNASLITEALELFVVLCVAGKMVGSLWGSSRNPSRIPPPPPATVGTIARA